MNFSARIITLTTRKTRGGESRRDDLPMSDGLYEDLKWWWGFEGREFRGEPWVFVCDMPGPNFGNPFKERRKFLKGLFARTGVRSFGFHALRRFVALRLVDDEKMSVKVVQRILRHRNVGTTERYVQGFNKDLRWAVSILRLGVSQGDLLPDLLPGKGVSEKCWQSQRDSNPCLRRERAVS